MKGKEKRKGKEKETCNRASINNLALILTRVISFGVPADDPYVLQPLKRTSTVHLLSWLLYDKNWLQETGRHLSLVGGGRGVMTIQMATMVIIDATNIKIAARKGCLAKSSFIDQWQNGARKSSRSSFQMDCWGSKVPEARPLSRNCQILCQRNVVRSSLSTLRF